MIREVAELHERGQVWRRVDELDVDVDTWRAAMRRTARSEGMRIRTFLVEPPDDPASPDGPASTTDPDDPAGGPPPGTRVYAVRTDLPPELDAIAAAVHALPAPPAHLLPGPDADIVSLTDQRARRSRHPCVDPHADPPT